MSFLYVCIYVLYSTECSVLQTFIAYNVINYSFVLYLGNHCELYFLVIMQQTYAACHFHTKNLYFQSNKLHYGDIISRLRGNTCTLVWDFHNFLWVHLCWPKLNYRHHLRQNIGTPLIRNLCGHMFQFVLTDLPDVIKNKQNQCKRHEYHFIRALVLKEFVLKGFTLLRLV